MSDQFHPWLSYIQSLSPDTKLLSDMLDEQDNKLTAKSLKFAMQNIKRRYGFPASIDFDGSWTIKTERQRQYEAEHSEPLYLIDSKGRTAYFDGTYGYLQWQPGFFLCLGWHDIWLVRRVHGKMKYWSDEKEYNKHWATRCDRADPYELLKDPTDLTYVDNVTEHLVNVLGYRDMEVSYWRAPVHAPKDLMSPIRSFLGLKAPVKRDRRKERIRKKHARKSR